jgi:hypothetical protein
VQIAKAFGAYVTGACSTSKVDLVRSIGADDVIDYTRDDFAISGQRYDLILDTAGAVLCRSFGAPSRPEEPSSLSEKKGAGGGSGASIATFGRPCCHRS